MLKFAIESSITMDYDFDSMLYRPIADGKGFEELIPKSTCKATASGKGDTDFSMKEIEEMVKQYSWQLKKVAKKLQKSSLNTSVENVKDFIYNHFQYKADKEEQLMRSPACSWYDRYNGIDCKSYSILASSLFTEMGILHYIRKIKQPGFEPTAWTHVYVIVPLNQETGQLQDGYFAVDGTLENDNEPAYIEKYDLKMSLQHYRLNAPANETGFSIDDLDKSIESVKTFFDKLNIDLGCIGSSAYPQSMLDTTLENINKYFNTLIARINTAVQNGDDETFSEAVNEFYGMSKLSVITAQKKLDRGWSNNCTAKRINVNVQAFKFYRDTVGQALTAWLSDNFTRDLLVQGTFVVWDNKELESPKYGFYFVESGQLMTVSEPFYYYDPKPKTIKAFEITPYIIEVGNGTKQFDPFQFIAGLSTVLGSGTNTGGNSVISPENNPKTAGFGAVGWVILLAGAGLFIKGLVSVKDEPKKEITK